MGLVLFFLLFISMITFFGRRSIRLSVVLVSFWGAVFAAPLGASDGSFTRQIPIQILPGTGGIQPNISLVYSSEAPWGIAGAGWQISGLGAISAKDIGGQLTWFGPGGKIILTRQGYRYEKENLSELIKLSPTVWEETLPNGTKVYYKQQVYQGQALTYLYALDRVEDASGLGYRVDYNDLGGNGQLYPRQIIYTTYNPPAGSQVSISLCKRILFEYDTRLDKRVAFHEGVAIYSEQRLAAVQVETNVSCQNPDGGGDLVRRYVLEYAPDTEGGPLSLSRLTGVKVSDSTGANFLPIESYSYPAFNAPGTTWVKEPKYNDSLHMVTYANGADKPQSRGQMVDINGDGLVDKVIAYNDDNGTVLRTFVQVASGWKHEPGLDLPITLINNADGVTNANGHLVDLNGDGLLDLIQAIGHPGGAVSKGVWLNDGTRWIKTVKYEHPGIITNFPLWTPMRKADYTKSVQQGQFADINGDGLADWLLSMYDTQLHTAAWINDGAGGWSYQGRYNLKEPLFNYGYGAGKPMRASQLIDLNGDGLLDQISSYNMPSGVKRNVAWLNTKNGWVRSANYTLPEIITNYANGVDAPISRGTFIDLNGDGLPDWITSFMSSRGTFRAKAYLNTGNGWVLDNNYALPDPLVDYSMNMAMLNNLCIIEVNRGTYPTPTDCEDTHAALAYKHGRPTGQFADVNGDGLIDWVRNFSYGYSSKRDQKVFLNNGRAFVGSQGYYLPPLTMHIYLENSVFYDTVTAGRLMELNGDGMVDWMTSYISTVGTNFNATYLSEVTPGSVHPHKMTLVTGAKGGATEVTYSNSLWMGGMVQTRYKSFPYVADRSPRQLVTRLVVSDGISQSYSTSFAYKDARVYAGDLALRRRLGFARMITTNDQSGDYTTQTFDQGLSVLEMAGLPTQSITRSFDGSLLQVQNSYFQKFLFRDQAGTPLGTYLIRPIQNGPASVQRGYEPGTGLLVSHSQTSILYNGDNFYDATLVKQKTEEIINPITNAPLYAFQTQSTYMPVEGGIVGRPHITTELVKKGIQDWVTQSKVTFAYDNAARPWLLSRRTDWYAEGADFVTSFTYDDVGNVESVTAPDGSVVKSAYDTDYFLYPQVESRGIFHSIKEYTSLGQVIAEYRHIDPGVVSSGPLTNAPPAGAEKMGSVTYDSFGREKTVFDHKGVERQNNIYPDGSLGQPAAQYSAGTVFNGTGFMESRSYFDGMGRTYKTESEAFVPGDARKYYTFREYNARGEVARESSPYLSDVTLTAPPADASWTKYSYDAYGRLSSVTTPAPPGSGVAEVTTTVSYRYVDDAVLNERLLLEEITDPNKKIYQTYYNSLGDVIKEVDPLSGTVTYEKTLDLLTGGTSLTVTAADGSTSTVTFDHLGQKIKMVDSNSGTWSYFYDVAGNMTSQSDPKGNSVTFQYDGYNRLVGKTSGTDTVSYTYDDSTTGKGRLVSMSDSSGVTTYGYDASGRTTAISKAVNIHSADIYNAASFTATFQMAYDDLDRVTELTYPDGTIVRSTYSAHGALQQLKMQQPGQVGESTMVTYEGPFETTPGAPFVKRITGNNIHTEIYFDPVTHMPTRLKSYLEGAANNLQDLSYNYDKLGNITQIDDALKPEASQSFVYDDTSRLTEATSGLYGTLQYQYTPGGNLIQKGDINKPLTLSYTADCPSTPGANVSVQAVCSATAGPNTYTYQYDRNGNMTRRGKSGGVYRDFLYDNEDRLIKVQGQTPGTTTEFAYDSGGQRTVKASPDGTVTYYIGGLYEVMFTPDGTQTHTKYVYGAQGDLVAQHADNTLTVAALNQTSFLARAGIDLKSPSALVASLYATLSGAWQNAGSGVREYFATHQTPLPVWLFVFSVFGLLVVYFKNNFLWVSQQIQYTNPRKRGMAELSTILLVAFSSLFVFNCFNLPYNNVNTVPGANYNPTLSPPMEVPVSMYNDIAQNARPTPGLLYFHPNHLGSTALVTDETGTVQAEIHYKPYGEVIRDDSTLAGPGSASNGSDSFRYKYTGQEEDPETSLMYYNARYYDPMLGRFTSQDTMVDPGAGTGGLNRYMYVGGNPVMGRDPSGHLVLETMLIGALVGGIISGVGAAAGCGCTGAEQFGALIGGFLIGAISGFAGGGIGGLLIEAGASGALGGIIGGFVGGAISGAGNALINGTDVAVGMANGALVGGIIGGLLGFAGDMLGVFSAKLNNAAADLLSGKTTLKPAGMEWQDNPFWSWLSDSPAGQIIMKNETMRSFVQKTQEVIVTKMAKELAQKLIKTAQFLESLNKTLTDVKIFVDPVTSNVIASYYQNPFHYMTGNPNIAINGHAVAGSGGVGVWYFPKAIGEVAMTFGGGAVIKSSGYAWKLLKGGKTFAQFKRAYWARNAKPVLEPLINPKTGQVWKQYMELHHRFIPQRAEVPNWLKNNSLNLKAMSSLEHAMVDPYRARFAPTWVKEMYNLSW